MKSKNDSISFSGRAGDVTSIDATTKGAEEAITRPPAEAILAQPAEDLGPYPSAWAELNSLFEPMKLDPKSRRIFMLIGLTMNVLVLNVIGEIRMNKWQGAFYRAIEHKNMTEITQQAFTFVIIMLVLLSIVVSQNWLLERFKIRLREWLTEYLLDRWMSPGHAYRLNMTSEERLNPDQRIQEDVKHFSEMSGDLGIGSARATLMLVSFVGVLWSMSSGITFNIGGEVVSIPGYMVWFALFYAALGSWLAARVGTPLIKLNEERYTREANFRYSLVRVSDNAESIAFYSGEKDERKIVSTTLQKVLGDIEEPLVQERALNLDRLRPRLDGSDSSGTRRPAGVSTRKIRFWWADDGRWCL